MELVPLIYDIVTVLIFLSMILTCMKQGFVSSIIAFAGYLLSILAAGTLAGPASDFVYQRFVRPPIEQKIAESLAQAGSAVLPQDLSGLLESIPDTLLDFANIDRSALESALRGISSGEMSAVASGITVAVVAPMVTAMLNMIFFLLFFGVAMFLVRKVVWLFRTVNRIPLVGALNRALGGALGAAQAALTIYLIAAVLNMTCSFLGGEFVLHLNSGPVVLAGNSVTEQTFFYKIFANLNPLEIFLAIRQEASGSHLFQNDPSVFLI